MDIVGGLAAISKALDVVKALREFDRSYDQATVKAKMADLYGDLAEEKVALSNARLALVEKNEEIAALQKELSGESRREPCPLCEVGRLKVAGVRPDPVFGRMGVQRHDLVCTNEECNHTESRQVDPKNRAKSR